MTFNEAAEAIKTLSSRPSNETLLQLYALFKQGTEGDVTGNRPGLLDPKGRAKFDAWTQKKSLSKEESQQQYIALVKTLLK
ncbi:acyl-CoA-binding protein [bacterium]|nr:acyl-CoA-binding protein [bacterium]